MAGRVLIGIGQGLALTAGSIYIGELAPQEIRGMIMSFWQMFYSVGSFIAYWIVSIPGRARRPTEIFSDKRIHRTLAPPSMWRSWESGIGSWWLSSSSLSPSSSLCKHPS